LDGRPLVLVSLGTVYAHGASFLRTAMAELADGPWQVVLATGGDPVMADAAPGNFIVRPSVPQVDILRRASAFVTHAGMNSVQEALYYGVPLVMAPQAADQFWISARTAELGAGRVLDASRLHAGAIRSSVAEVLSGPGYADAAARISRSLRAAGGPTRAADEIQGWMSNWMSKKACCAVPAVWGDTSPERARGEKAGALG
jgi:MGT family glycosyltransferase